MGSTESDGLNRSPPATLVKPSGSPTPLSPAPPTVEKEITPTTSSLPTPIGQTKTKTPPTKSFADAVQGEGHRQTGPHFLNPDSPKVGAVSNRDGVRAAVFSQEDVLPLSAPFQHTLVGKFSFGRPQFAKIKQHLVTIGYHSIKCRLFGIPIHLFDRKALFTIGELIREPLKIDDATKTLSRINFARICIEIDLKMKPPSEVCVVNAGEVLVIPVVYERLPQYCSHCFHLGHEETSCYIKNAGPGPRRNLEKSFPQQKSDKGKGLANTQPPNSQEAGPSEIRTEERFEVKTAVPIQVQNSFDAFALIPYAGR
ncbi:hypothetical protein CDL12_25832 [Handroanthus impetiginosus]|uniref:DUF4283 domain-containing protein n=1 Tax=Handroanthus impetiginosus TaxID=429701 RepID=A0A2G9G8N7_9LAMI|nr:hypothetical protein CDL12_25832 [Handroanthus impetiginosus]